MNTTNIAILAAAAVVITALIVHDDGQTIGRREAHIIDCRMVDGPTPYRECTARPRNDMDQLCHHPRCMVVVWEENGHEVGDPVGE